MTRIFKYWELILENYLQETNKIIKLLITIKDRLKDELTYSGF